MLNINISIKIAEVSQKILLNRNKDHHLVFFRGTGGFWSSHGFQGERKGDQSSAYAFSTNVLFEQENVIFIEEGSPLRAILLHAAIPQMKINRTVPYKVRWIIVLSTFPTIIQDKRIVVVTCSTDFAQMYILEAEIVPSTNKRVYRCECYGNQGSVGTIFKKYSMHHALMAMSLDNMKVTHHLLPYMKKTIPWTSGWGQAILTK